MPGYVKDEKLTKRQSDIKWYLYCEIEMEDTKDVIAAVKSLLGDLEGKVNDKE